MSGLSACRTRNTAPVDLETLLEWKEEGRLIPANPVRREGEAEWADAGTIPALFPPAVAPGAGSDLPIHRRTFGEIITQTLRIYLKGFPLFFALALMVAVPSLGLKLSLAFVNSLPGEPLSGTARIAAVVAVVMLLALLAAWPIFLGGLQVATSELAAGRAITLADVLQRAKSLWARIAKLAMFVYGSFMFWTALPLVAILALASSPSVVRSSWRCSPWRSRSTWLVDCSLSSCSGSNRRRSVNSKASRRCATAMNSRAAEAMSPGGNGRSTAARCWLPSG
jgi:hypothetical protein